MADESQRRRDVVAVGRVLYEKDLAIATDGNISVRLDDERLLTTPSGVCKGMLEADGLVVTDMAGRCLSGGKPSSELRLHLAVYEARPDVRAVVHAHPPVATAFTVAGIGLDEPVLPEVVFTLGAIPTARYATPSSAQGPEVVRELIGDHDAILLDHHGAVTCGPDVWDAQKKMEKVEHAARTVLAARQLGRVRVLPPDEVQRLVGVHEQLGLPGRVARPEAGQAGEPVPGRLTEEDVERIAEAVARRLAERRA